MPPLMTASRQRRNRRRRRRGHGARDPRPALLAVAGPGLVAGAVQAARVGLALVALDALIPGATEALAGFLHPVRFEWLFM